MNEFDEQVMLIEGESLRSKTLDVLQVNVGLVCNQECVHCHVSSSPRRKEVMRWEVMEKIIDTAKLIDCKLVDITGGAPELNPNFKKLVNQLRRNGQKVQVRTNLTILLESGFEEMPEFYRENKIELVASLPCYLQENVDAQRGEGVYTKSIEAIKLLNQVGYGVDPDLPLNLVYNPVGPYLPPNQKNLEKDYKQELKERFGIFFSNLHTITNMPIGRFWVDLRKKKKHLDYLEMLKSSFNPGTLPELMCRHQVNIDWDGSMYDCDFNLALKLKVNHGAPTNIQHFDPEVLANRMIVTGQHCFGCTAGSGSSCGGALI